MVKLNQSKNYIFQIYGLIYEAFTQFIGFKKYGEEYKIMGLSSLGNPKYKEIIKKICSKILII